GAPPVESSAHTGGVPESPPPAITIVDPHERRSTSSALVATERALRRTALVAFGAGLVHAALAAFLYERLVLGARGTVDAPSAAALLLVFGTPAALSMALVYGGQRGLLVAIAGWIA